MGQHTSKSGRDSERAIREKIDTLRRELTKPFEPTGRKGWQKQLDADTKRKAKAERQIAELEKQLNGGNTKQTVPAKNTPKEKTAAPTWRRAGEGWYIGPAGHEIREGNDGGYDVVKVMGRSETTVQHFDKLADAKKYNPS